MQENQNNSLYTTFLGVSNGLITLVVISGEIFETRDLSYDVASGSAFKKINHS